MADDRSIHVDPATLVLLEERTLDSRARDRALSHLEACGRCQAELSLVRRYRAVPPGARLDGVRSERLQATFREKLAARLEPREQEGRVRPRRRAIRLGPVRLAGSSRDWMVRGLVAASLTLLAVGAHQMLESTGPGELGRSFRSGEVGPAVLELRVDSTVAGWTLSWPPLEGVATYHVRVLSVRGVTLLDEDVEGSEVRIERSALGDVELPQLLLVQVEATDPYGQIVRSEPVPLPDPR